MLENLKELLLIIWRLEGLDQVYKQLLIGLDPSDISENKIETIIKMKG